MTDIRDEDPSGSAPADGWGSDPTTGDGRRRWSRRRLLTVGLGGAAAVVVAGVVGLELVAHGDLPGQQTLDRYDGACSVPGTPLDVADPGPSVSGWFFSHARNRAVAYTIAYPPGHGPGSSLPLVVMLHGFGGNHASALSGMSPAEAVALRVDGAPLAPMALVTVDGGEGYWNPHPGDDPMAMVIDELIPMCQGLGLGRPPQRIGTMGISMGGYGALLFAEKYPSVVSAVAAISPAVWTSYDQARAANAGAYASAADFAADDAVTHAGALAGALPADAVVEFSTGCHDGAYFVSQEPPSLAFLAGHLTGRRTP